MLVCCQWPGMQPHKVPKSAKYTNKCQGRAKIAYQVAEIMYNYIEVRRATRAE